VVTRPNSSTPGLSACRSWIACTRNKRWAKRPRKWRHWRRRSVRRTRSHSLSANSTGESSQASRISPIVSSRSGFGGPPSSPATPQAEQPACALRSLVQHSLRNGHGRRVKYARGRAHRGSVGRPRPADRRARTLAGGCAAAIPRRPRRVGGSRQGAEGTAGAALLGPGQ